MLTYEPWGCLPCGASQMAQKHCQGSAHPTWTHTAPCPGWLPVDTPEGRRALFGEDELLLGHSGASYSVRPHGLQHIRPSFPSPSPGACSDSCPLSRWCHPTISSLVTSSSPPALNPSQHHALFRWVDSLHQVGKVLELQHQSFQWIFRTDLL